MEESEEPGGQIRIGGDELSSVFNHALGLTSFACSPKEGIEMAALALKGYVNAKTEAFNNE